MCVRAWCDGPTGVPLVLAGFDDGGIIIWDTRQPSTELTSLKLFSEPGEISRKLYTHWVVQQLLLFHALLWQLCV